jgi:hypothetical protein
LKVYFDENFSKYIAEALNCLQKGYRQDDVEVLHVAQEFGKGLPDEDWIPRVAQHHGVIVTEDMNIHRTRSQYALCQQNKVGVFFLRPPRHTPFRYWQWVDIIIRHWAAVKELAGREARPFSFVITPHCREPERLS